jgi:hypothetical protein
VDVSADNPDAGGRTGNPIWASSSSALNQRLAGTITVDIGATLLSLAQYCAVVAAALVTEAKTPPREAGPLDTGQLDQPLGTLSVLRLLPFSVGCST